MRFLYTLLLLLWNNWPTATTRWCACDRAACEHARLSSEENSKHCISAAAACRYCSSSCPQRRRARDGSDTSREPRARLKKMGLGANREALVYASPRHGPHGPLDSKGTSMDELHLGAKKSYQLCSRGKQRAVFLSLWPGTALRGGPTPAYGTTHQCQWGWKLNIRLMHFPWIKLVPEHKLHESLWDPFAWCPFETRLIN